MQIALKKILVKPGQQLLLTDISWQEFEDILEDLGEHRASKVAYENGILEIMTPLPEHEINKEIISDLIKALLEELDINFFSLGSTTFKNQSIGKGIEPDNCFYIQNEAVVRGKTKLDLSTDPPPDLALEIDVTSRTHLNIYQSLKVPELWRFDRGKLEINILQDDRYIESQFSPNFSNFHLIEIIPQYLDRARTEGRNKTMKAFRTWVRKQIF